MSRQTQGLLIVFTGNGKGKTTAAVGMAVRAAGHDLRVAFVQLLKSTPPGELAYVKGDRRIEVHPMSQGYQLSHDSLVVDRELALAAWRRGAAAIAGGKHAMVVLDDLNFVLGYELLPLDDVLAALRRRPPEVHVVVTGRNAPERLLAQADLVTEMVAVRHPFMDGMPPQAGVEY